MNFDKTNYIYEIKDVKQYYRKTRDERIKVKGPENVADYCKKLIGNSGTAPLLRELNKNTIF
ncbi:hypothetical protein I6G25_11550 (plasmid) [Macrococcoides caseolyticum]|uniref:hypothetical protein n=1 Tax=Macrococcoides caseolyticum TaxID=69966 RepID=UPI0018D96396|nr:hypothetical protein [Macrococcus caseolyticus]QPT47843.1 hypothetical protein I6G25_11550 [Macrococcus caseolyticus]